MSDNLNSPAPNPPALDPDSLEPKLGSSYPAPFRDACGAREKRALGDALGLTHYGVNLVRLPPGATSAQRHWHTHEDEFVYVLEGALVLITEDGEQTLTAGTAAGFPAGKEDGHQLVNRSDAWAVYLEIGNRSDADEVHYPDVDLFLTMRNGDWVFTHKNGEPYE